ncbi:MAG: hypothetical protein ACXVD2_07245 [Actinomycetota bacterium]
MDLVVASPEAPPLGHMIAELVRGNLEAHPPRAALLHGVAGRVNLKAKDIDVTIGLVLTGSSLQVGTAHPAPDLEVICDSGTLMELSSVPLRFGRPDPMTPAGRAMLGKILRREVVVRGMLAHPRLLTRVQKLLSVA